MTHKFRNFICLFMDDAIAAVITVIAESNDRIFDHNRMFSIWQIHIEGAANQPTASTPNANVPKRTRAIQIYTRRTHIDMENWPYRECI